MKKNPKLFIRYLAASILALAGICLLLYPKVDNWLYVNRVTSEKEAFLKRTHGTIDIGGNSGGSSDGSDNGSSRGGGAGGSFANDGNDGYAPALLDPYEKLYRFLNDENIRLYESGQDELVDAFSYQTAGIDLSGFGLEDGCIGYLEIPSIKAIMPIYLGANAQNMKKGAAHMTQTSYPISGINTNAVLAAHRGGALEMLRNIHLIQIGDEIIITNFRERLVYEAIESKIILPADIGEVKIQEGQDLITLLSCNPLGKNYQRYVLYCKKIDN